MNDTVQFDMHVEIPKSMISGLLTQALESACHYWYTKVEILQYPKGKSRSDYRYPLYEVPLEPGGLIGIKDICGHEHEIGLHTIIRGLKTIAIKFPRHWPDIIKQTDDDDTADAFLQSCLYEEIRYS